MSTTPRTDAAWAASFSPERPNFLVRDECEKLETELAAARSERDLAITRVASILWSGAIDKHTCGDVQKWVTDYTAELARLRAGLAVAENWVEHHSKHADDLIAENVKLRAEKAEAEVERLKKQIKDDNRSYGCELRDPNGTIWEQAAKDHARAERAEAMLAFIAANGGTTHETECGPIACNGSWCAEQARAAIDAAMKP